MVKARSGTYHAQWGSSRNFCARNMVALFQGRPHLCSKWLPACRTLHPNHGPSWGLSLFQTLQHKSSIHFSDSSQLERVPHLLQKEPGPQGQCNWPPQMCWNSLPVGTFSTQKLPVSQKEFSIFLFSLYLLVYPSFALSEVSESHWILSLKGTSRELLHLSFSYAKKLYPNQRVTTSSLRPLT